MAKAVLISIRPEWVEEIASGEKTLELRKTEPKLETPFKVYIYCTAGNLSYKVNGGMVCNVSGGKMVVGEFVCDKITWLTHIGFSGLPWIRLAAMKNGHTIDDSFDFSESCLTTPQIEKYLGGRDGYAWHISNLKIYDAPKELPQFRKCCGTQDCDKCQFWENTGEYAGCLTSEERRLNRAPQSWRYVEELK